MKIITLTIMSMLILTSLVVADNFKITAYSDDRNILERFFDSIFAISGTKASYNIGETVRFTDTIYLSNNCPLGDYINYNWRITSSGSSYKTGSGQLLGTSISSVSYDVSWQTSGVPAGTYEISTTWTCSDTIYGGTTTFLGSGFQSIKLLSTSTPPTEQCTKSCNTGFELKDSGSSDCYCEQKFTLNNGECEVGEKENNSNAVDCQATNQECSGDEYKCESGILFTCTPDNTFGEVGASPPNSAPDGTFCNPNEEEVIQYYRFEDNQCSPVVILPSEKTSNDYSQTECESKITEGNVDTNVDTDGNQTNTNGNQTITPTPKSDENDYTGVFIIGGFLVGGYFLYNSQLNKRKRR